jgi:Protein of unknown function (DUF1566)
MHNCHILLFSLCSLISTLTISPQLYADEPRYLPLNSAGKPLSEPEKNRLTEWPCTYDRHTGLTWENKTRQPGLHYQHNTYSWFHSDPNHNGGWSGTANNQQCHTATERIAANEPSAAITHCNTQTFITAVNNSALCGAKNWRLPRREELRSLVDYRIAYPGPTIDQHAFPNTIAQFYWSSDSAAAKNSEAWGIGFAFGFDYAYYKSNHVHVRLVHDNNPIKIK